MDIYVIIFLTLIAALITSVSQFSYKRSLKRIGSLRDLLKLLTNKGVILGLLGYIVGLGFYLAALYGGALSVVYPIFASCFIFVTLISAVKFKEKITPVMVIGMLLVFLGIAMVAI